MQVTNYVEEAIEILGRYGTVGSRDEETAKFLKRKYAPAQHFMIPESGRILNDGYYYGNKY